MSNRIGKEVDFEIDSSWDARTSFDVVNMSMTSREALVLMEVMIDQLKDGKTTINIRGRGKFRSEE